MQLKDLTELAAAHEKLVNNLDDLGLENLDSVSLHLNHKKLSQIVKYNEQILIKTWGSKGWFELKMVTEFINHLLDEIDNLIADGVNHED